MINQNKTNFLPFRSYNPVKKRQINKLFYIMVLSTMIVKYEMAWDHTDEVICTWCILGDGLRLAIGRQAFILTLKLNL